MPDPAQSTELPTLVVDPRTGRITVQEIGAGAGQPAQGRSAPALGPQRPEGSLTPGSMPNLFAGAEGGILPVLMGILAAPFTHGMSLPAAMGVTGGASAMGEFGRQQLAGEDTDLSDIVWEGATGAAPTALGKWANTSRKGTRMIKNVVAEGQPARASERLTAAAKDSRISKLTTDAINDVVQKTIDLENSMFDKAGKLIVTPVQARAIKQRIAKMEELVTRLRTIPADEESFLRLRVGGDGKVSAGLNMLTNPSSRLAVGQKLDQAGPYAQWTVEGMLRALMGMNELDDARVERNLAGAK